MKHNKWIDGLVAGKIFFNWIRIIGYAFLILTFLITTVFFWAFILSSEQFAFLHGTAIIILNLVRLGVILLIGGIIFNWLCDIIALILVRKEVRRQAEEAAKIFTDGLKPKPKLKKLKL